MIVPFAACILILRLYCRLWAQL